MPSASGVYTLPTGYLAVTGATIQASQHNPPLEDIAAALTARLSRDGSAAMTGPLQLAVGAVGAPGAVFAADPSSGFYKTTSGIGVAIGGVKSGEFLAGGFVGARYVGELIPFTGTAAPSNLTVLPFGQTLSRTGQPQLWAFAQIEIAAGNTFYNNGDGSTTFGIGDMRGRLPIGWDKMGGTLASRLTAAGGGVDGSTLGTAGGGQNGTILQANLPAATLTTTIVDPGHVHGENIPNAGGGASWNNANGAGNSSTFYAPGINTASATTGITASTQLGGSGTAFKIVPPAIVCNYLLFVGD